MDRIEELEARIAELRARLPKHSAPTAMLVQLEDLESELEDARAATATGEASEPAGNDA